MPFIRPRPNGIPEPEEWDYLLGFEGKLIEAFATRNKAVFAGHIYMGGGYQGYFYASAWDGMDRTLDQVAASMPRNGPHYDVEMGGREDPDWEFYRQHLYPNPLGMQSILTSQVVQMLEKDGDDLKKSRPVRHMLSFKDENAAKAFARRVLKEKFSIEKEFKNEDSQLPFVTIISRNDTVESHSIDHTVSWVFLQAVECGGKYEGWEALNLSSKYPTPTFTGNQRR